jgi:hypothetical protein
LCSFLAQSLDEILVRLSVFNKLDERLSKRDLLDEEVPISLRVLREVDRAAVEESSEESCSENDA